MHRAIVSFLISFVLLMVVIAFSRISYNNAEKFAKQAEVSRNVITTFDALDLGLRSAETYSTDYDSTSSNIFYALYRSEMESLPDTMASLKELVKNDRRQTGILDSIQYLIDRQLPVLRQKSVTQIISAGESSRLDDLAQAHRLIKTGRRVEEQTLQEQKADLDKTNKQNNLFTLLLAILAVAIVTWTFIAHLFLSKKSQLLEGFLESVLNTSQNAILHCRAIRQRRKIVDFKLEFANDASADLLRVKAAAVAGKRWSAIPTLQSTTLFAVCIEVVSSGVAQKLEYVDVEDNKERWFAVSLARMGDGVTISCYETTDIKRTERELTKNNAALVNSNRELEEYAYAASHDLQEPLRKIRTFGGFLQDSQGEKLDDRGKNYLDKILQSAERMTLLIRDLLSFSGLKQEEEFVPTDLEEVLSNVMGDLEIAIAQSKATITHDPLPEIDAIPIQMNQLFYNLVSNSLKFGQDGVPLQVNIACRKVSATDVADIEGLATGKEYYEMVVSDNGIGFNPDYAAQIFGLFKRLNDKSRYSGSGIGLALCKKVVNNHGGVIAANGKEGLGAQFYIYLPPTQEQTVIG